VAKNNPKFFEACLKIVDSKDVESIYGLIERMREKVLSKKLSTDHAIASVQNEYTHLTDMNQYKYAKEPQKTYESFSQLEGV
jgi:hypothetical protein